MTSCQAFSLVLPTRYLEIGNRDPQDAVVYSDVDLLFRKDAQGVWVYTRRDGTPY